MGILDSNFDPNALGSNQMLQMGLGILANNQGHGGAFAPAFGGGVQQGMQQAQAFRQQQLMNEYRKRQEDFQKQQFDTQQANRTEDRGWQVADKAENRGFQVSDKADDREFQRLQGKESFGQQLTLQEKQFAQQYQMQKQNQNFQASEGVKNRAVKDTSGAPVMVMNPLTKKPMFVNRSDAIGLQPYSAADDAKAVALSAKEEAKKDGAAIVDSNISMLRDSYSKLNEGDGITSTQKGLGANLLGAIGKSGVGQFVGGTVGTNNQTERDTIAQTRPLLLQSIMKATGMSAKQMDSNAELKLWLSTATDPSKSLEANQRALNNIARMYGSEAIGGVTGDTTQPPQVDFQSLAQKELARRKGKK